MCNSSGSIVARYSYDPYGRTTLVQGANLATFQYAGYYVHGTSGLALTLYRAYDENTGRWLSRDPIEEEGGHNLYEYVADDPAMWLDPYGEQTLPAPTMALPNSCPNPCQYLQDKVNELEEKIQNDRVQLAYWRKLYNTDEAELQELMGGAPTDFAKSQTAGMILDATMGEGAGLILAPVDLAKAMHDPTRINDLESEMRDYRSKINYWNGKKTSDQIELLKAKYSLRQCLKKDAPE